VAPAASTALRIGLTAVAGGASGWVGSAESAQGFDTPWQGGLQCVAPGLWILAFGAGVGLLGTAAVC